MNVNIEAESFEKLGAQVHRALRYYVYLYKDPDTDEPFYVGKGNGDRILAHHGITGDSDKGRKLEELRQRGIKPKLVVVRHGMTEDEALAVEAVLIEHIGLSNLTNIVTGRGTSTHGLMTLPQIRSRYSAPVVKSFDAQTLLFRLTRSFRYSMAGDDANDRDRLELYEATRGTWKLGDNRKRMKYAMAVFDNVIQEIYEIKDWHQAGTTKYETRKDVGDPDPERYEFVGTLCQNAEVRSRYIGGDVSEWFPHGFTGPVRYCWLQDSENAEN